MDRHGAPRSDAALLRAADDPQAFAAFYRRYERLVLGWLVGRTASIEDAADLTAETFAAAWLVRQRYADAPAGAAPWLLGIAGNKLRMSHRRRRIERAACERLGLERLPVAVSDQQHLAELFSDADAWLAELPEDQRAAVRAHVVDEERYSEIAARLQIAEPTARKRVSRGLAALNRHLKPEGEGP